MSYLEEATTIWREFVPPSGQADTVQGELLRTVEKLRDEAIRNGNGNWDQGFEMLLAFLHQHLLDENAYPPHMIEETRSVLVGLRDGNDTWLQDEPYDFLGDRVVDYFRYYGSEPHTRNSALYR